MEQELLRYLLAAFPRSSAAPSLDANDDYLVVQGYRVPFAWPVDEAMLGILADFRRTGFSSERLTGVDRG